MVVFIIFILVCVVLVSIILIATYFINIPHNDYEKHSAYECGFEPFGDARSFFDVQFYTIGLLFILFDLEVVFLLPFVIDISSISAWGYLTMLLFMVVVVIGFYYEWALGLLNWVPSKKYPITLVKKRILKKRIPWILPLLPLRPAAEPEQIFYIRIKNEIVKEWNDFWL